MFIVTKPLWTCSHLLSFSTLPGVAFRKIVLQDDWWNRLSKTYHIITQINTNTTSACKIEWKLGGTWGKQINFWEINWEKQEVKSWILDAWKQLSHICSINIMHNIMLLLLISFCEACEWLLAPHKIQLYTLQNILASLTVSLTEKLFLSKLLLYQPNMLLQ